ncbi:MAG TPA: hypothetical protein VKI17_06390 [Gemmataceae bacterium]|nr:hypothetical protein [Gemmataceae bacterium]
MMALMALCMEQGPKRSFAFQPAAVASADNDEASLQACQTALVVFKQDWAAKERITENVISGRMTLLQGAARFQGVYARRPQNPFCVAKVQLFPGASEGERLCRQIIQWVKMRLEKDPSRDQVVARLTTELHAHLARQGCICLPECPAEE